MKRVQRSELVDYQTYEDGRTEYRAQMLAEKEPRRIHVGEYLTFLFETTNTVRYQVQEMMRVERIVRDKDIQHELDTYNALLGDRGTLGCTLLIEIDNEAKRNELLRAWLGLPKHLYILLSDGKKARAQWDPSQVGDDRLSSVQYLKFEVGDGGPQAIGSDHPELSVETVLTEAQKSALTSDARS